MTFAVVSRMRQLIVVAVLTLGPVACKSAPWPGPGPLAPDPGAPSQTMVSSAEIGDAGAAPPKYGDTRFTPRADEPVPVDPSAPDPEPVELTVEKRYEIR